jgi:hypothetical protein
MTFRFAFTVLFLFCTISALQSQEVYKYAIFFKKKGINNPYSVKQPEAYLSLRAIERKNRMGIKISKTDLPVNPKYVREIEKLIPGAQMLNKSNWLNFVVIQTLDSTWRNSIKLPNYVKEIKLIYAGSPPKSTSNRVFSPSTAGNDCSKIDLKAIQYGSADFQVKSLKLNELHQQNKLGQDIVIAVLDGGFSNVDKIEAFHHLRQANRILGTFDFAGNETEVYGDGEHGTMVLGCMAGYVENKILGTAPFASYYLLRTEETGSETVSEEYNWVSGAEFADSVGADLINSSLGYTKFDKNNGSYTYDDMNGKTALISRGANIAVSKGILVVNSAGNSGNDSWKYIGAPADAERVFSIGATNKLDERVAFSSVGPTSDGRIKPNVMALGSYSAVINSAGSVTNASGTSFSSPIMCGALACLMQKHKYLKPESIMRAVEASSNNATTPNAEMGYGIPDFTKADKLLSEKKKR